MIWFVSNRLAMTVNRSVLLARPSTIFAVRSSVVGCDHRKLSWASRRVGGQTHQAEVQEMPMLTLEEDRLETLALGLWHDLLNLDRFDGRTGELELGPEEPEDFVVLASARCDPVRVPTCAKPRQVSA